jgi:Putative bacterial sensory transduction regulator
MSDAPKRIGIRPFDRDMIKVHLDSREMQYDVDDDGDFQFGVKVNEEDELTLAIFLGAEGTNEDILVVRAIAMAAIPREMWMPVMSACNQWNLERRYPKAYLAVGGDPSLPETQGEVHLEGQYPLGAGVTQPLVDDLISETVSSSLAYWQWMPGWVQNAQQASQAAEAGADGATAVGDGPSEPVGDPTLN